MLIQSYLALHTNRLKLLEKWTCEGDELFLVFPGTGVWQITSYGNSLPVAGGDVIVMTGRSETKLLAMSDTEQSFSWFSISLDSLYPLFAAGEISFLQNIPQVLRGPKVYTGPSPITIQCHELLADLAPRSDLNHRSQLLRVTALLLSLELNSWRQQQFGFESSEDHMMRIFEQLSTQQLLNLSVEELSQKFGCSRRHLSRLFHQRFGMSVASFRMEMRLLRALSLLRDPGVKVINVAEQCGFNHLGLFNTCFKRRFGVTPGMWRNTHTETQKNQSREPAPKIDKCPLQANGFCPLSNKLEHSSLGNFKQVKMQDSDAPRPAAITGRGLKVRLPFRVETKETKDRPVSSHLSLRPNGGTTSHRSNVAICQPGKICP
jgi:AraC-like DNA-binding protein